MAEKFVDFREVLVEAVAREEGREEARGDHERP